MDLVNILGGLKREDEVSQSERAYQFIVDWIAMNESLFNNPDFSIKILGKIDRDGCMFNQSELQSVLEENGFDFNAVKKDWAEAGYLEKTRGGKYAHLTTVGNRDTRARYVKINLTRGFLIDDLEDCKDSEIPFGANL